MVFKFRNWRRSKREQNSLTKYIYLSSKDITYRLALEHFNYKRENIPFDQWYLGFLSVKPARDRHFFINLFALMVLVIANFGLLKTLDFNGIKIQGQLLFPAIFMAYSYSSMIFSYHQAKIKKFEDVFHSAFENAQQSEKIKLLLTYPLVYNALQFNPFISGNPKHMYPDRDYPIRLIFILTLMTLVSIPYILLALWAVISATNRIYQETMEVSIWLGWGVIATSWFFILASVLLTTGYTKRRFVHFGLVNILQKMGAGSSQHARAWSRINRIIKAGDQ